MFKNRYRIITDNYSGFEAQVKYWFFPIMWLQIGVQGFSNTSTTIKQAEAVIRGHKQVVIKYI